MNIVLREDQKEELVKEFNETGVRYTETIRRALDEYFKKTKKKKGE
jgi:hypothetical protein